MQKFLADSNEYKWSALLVEFWFNWNLWNNNTEDVGILGTCTWSLDFFFFFFFNQKGKKIAYLLGGELVVMS